MMENLEFYMPLIFAGLMGLAVLFYVVLDGYDLGVGMLCMFAEKKEKDAMIASIGPFWDANETWLVLTVGLLLIAFPRASALIFSSLYLTTVLMLIGLILRGISFDLRAKVAVEYQSLWDITFIMGSLLTTFCQGYMLGKYIVGFSDTVSAEFFAIMTGCLLIGGYALLGGSWLIMKSEGALQIKAVKWTNDALYATAVGVALVSVVTPLVSSRIFVKWFSLPNFLYLFPIPIITGILTMKLWSELKRLRSELKLVDSVVHSQSNLRPFLLSVSIFILCFIGLAYSFYPYVVPKALTIWEAAADPATLKMILYGAVVVLPCILMYTVFCYKVFWGKVSDLHYY